MKNGLIEYTNRDKAWYLDDNFHREDGPAIEYADGDKSWFLHGNFHREDGPAIEYADGDKEWYLYGKSYTEEEYWNEVISLIIKRKTLDFA